METLRKFININHKLINSHARYFGEYSFLAYYKEKPIGYIMCVGNGNKLLIWQIGIITEYRKKKLSGLLIKRAVEAAARNNMIINVSISEDNLDSYYAFKNYCLKNNLIMSPVGMISLKAEEDPQFSENEILYEICTQKNT